MAIAPNDPRWKVAKSLRFRFPDEHAAQAAFYAIDRKMPDVAKLIPHAESIEAAPKNDADAKVIRKLVDEHRGEEV